MREGCFSLFHILYIVSTISFYNTLSAALLLSNWVKLERGSGRNSSQASTPSEVNNVVEELNFCWFDGRILFPPSSLPVCLLLSPSAAPPSPCLCTPPTYPGFGPRGTMAARRGAPPLFINHVLPYVPVVFDEPKVAPPPLPWCTPSSPGGPPPQ
jgi:hypothetical protein